jgi:hypothetical protein
VVAAILDFQSTQKKLCRGSPNDQSRIQFRFKEISGFGKKLFVHFLYGPMLKLCLVVGEHLEILINIKKTFKRPYKEHS